MELQTMLLRMSPSRSQESHSRTVAVSGDAGSSTLTHCCLSVGLVGDGHAARVLPVQADLVRGHIGVDSSCVGSFGGICGPPALRLCHALQTQQAFSTA